MRIGVGAMWLNQSATSKNSGLARYAYRVIDGLLTSTSHELRVYGPRAFNPPKSWTETDRFVYVPGPGHPLSKRVLWERYGIARDLRKNPVDLWFSTTPSLPRATDAPQVAMVHDLIPLLFPEGHRRTTVLYTAWSLRKAHRQSKLLLSNSVSTKAELVKLLDVSPDRVTVTPLGPGNLVELCCRDEDSEAVLRKLGVPEGRYILALGNLEPRKNLELLLQAFSRLKPDFPDLSLVLAGAPRDQSVPTIFDREGVVRLGYVADECLPALFAWADVFCFPSLFEGFGLPVLEGMMLGAPVVASSIAAVREVGGNAILTFDPRSVDSLAESLSVVLESEEVASRMRVAGRRRAAEFTWEHTVSLTVEALERAAR